ncbi:hypothetical protein ACHAXR_009379 [Thalassiosira sp. AJA248-18]
MGLENARDSFVDLLQIKAEKQELQRLLKEQAGGQQNNNVRPGGGSSRQLKQQTSFRAKKGASSHAALSHASTGAGGYSSNEAPDDEDFLVYEELCYEPCEVEETDEEHWPVWELTGDDPWRDTPNGGGGENGNNSPSIAECERIFTVHEVYDEMQRQRHTRMSSMTLRNDPRNGGIDQGPCHSILNCFTPWKQQPAAPIVIQNSHSSKSHDAFLESMNPDSEQEDEEQLNPRGVMKRSSMAVQLYLGMPASVRQSFTPSMFVRLGDFGEDIHDAGEEEGGGGINRRRVSIVGRNNQQYAMGMNVGNHILENGNKETSAANKKMYKVHFSELKQVLRVRKFTPEEAIEVWFQREDFDFFKNEMTLLVQEDGASRELAEVWLDAKACENRRSSTFSEASEDDNVHGHSRKDNSSPTSGGMHRSRSWWHEYEHSRRGLERYASPGQARQILASYRVAVQKVLGEQQRQRLLACLCIPGVNDPEKIAEVYHEYTAWSRDLALAAGASDADAVRTNFDDEKRHTREYYMLKQVVSSGYKVHKHMPQFMLPNCIKAKGFLDEAESLYFNEIEGKGGGHRGKKSFGLMVRNAAAGVGSAKPLTGEEARNEMSRLDSKDLEGPVSPALAPSLQVEEAGATSSASSNNRVHKADSKRQSMAEKAKNYPFQQ